MQCPACNGEIDGGSRFCPLCGAETSRKPRNRAAPWIFAGATVAALSAALLVHLTAKHPAEAGDTVAAPATAAPPDISSMTPRERADRLFNRIMSAAERGDTAQVSFFLPMALESYTMLGTLDHDARYHVGVIDFVSGDWTGAAAQIDTILHENKDHLLALALRAQVATLRKDTAARDKAFRSFLSVYDRELKTGRPEYTDHRGILEWTRQEATKALGKAPA